jgi:hypothetical protein
MVKIRILALIALLLPLAACHKYVPVKPPSPVVQPPQPVSPEGVWQCAGRDGKTMKLILNPNGEAIFQGGLEYLNPGRWDWDPMRNKLTLLLPRAPDNKLEIFYLQVGHGVQYFDPARKLVAYHFDDETSELNVAGWIYSRRDAGEVKVAPEPTLK